MNNIPNRKAMCEVLIEEGQKNHNIVVLTSDSRGSASLVDFGEALPNQLIEVGIAEQDLVGISAGLAHSGKRPFAASPASFLSMRSIEQVKVDVAYSNTNVKLIGISGGVSYGALGMSHHSLQDFAVTRAIPNLQVLVPADRFETAAMFRELVKSERPAYIRLGRNPVEDCYSSEDYGFEIGKAVVMSEGSDITLVAIGETVRKALDAAEDLKKSGRSVEVINVHSLKPFDHETIRNSAMKTKKIITIEEHSIYGGLGSAVAESLSEIMDVQHKIIGFPDEELVTGESKEVFEYYGLSGKKLIQTIEDFVGE
ncbi:transketolase [Enterococcus sp. JM4C]|uniref:transketolase family protein n=1 Tax=Candidatus Enterococcus huntleyi TaxID=1857217 RepID=UPI001379B783|nr:transketolase C-terminal domain-containing protein [Enterococcus sp. JM4C]KAF1299403.1 transketolase [Enterococcus sp. JM4C]